MFGRAIWDKLRECIFVSFHTSNFKTFKYHEGDLAKKSPEPNVLLVYPTKPKNTFYWN